MILEILEHNPEEQLKPYTILQTLHLPQEITYKDLQQLIHELQNSRLLQGRSPIYRAKLGIYDNVGMTLEPVMFTPTKSFHTIYDDTPEELMGN